MRRSYRYYDLIMAAFVASLLCSNLIGVGKPVTILGFTFGGGALFFPLSYMFGDVLTEVYGYAKSRRVVWAGFGALIFASVMSCGAGNSSSRGIYRPSGHGRLPFVLDGLTQFF